MKAWGAVSSAPPCPPGRSPHRGRARRWRRERPGDVRLFRRVDHRDFTRAGACEALGHDVRAEDRAASRRPVMNGAMTSMRWTGRTAAAAGGGDLHDDVGRLLDDGVRNGIDGDVRPAVPGHCALLRSSPRWGRDRPLGRPTCPFVTWIAGLSTRHRVAFTLRSPPITDRRITFVESCGPDHKTAGQYPLVHITNRSRRVYMGPAPLPGSACGMPANGSQVHEFAPPGPPPRRGIGTRHRVRFDLWDGPRNVAATS